MESNKLDTCEMCQMGVRLSRGTPAANYNEELENGRQVIKSGTIFLTFIYPGSKRLNLSCRSKNMIDSD